MEMDLICLEFAKWRTRQFLIVWQINSYPIWIIKLLTWNLPIIVELITGFCIKQNKFKLLNLQADTIHLSDGWPTRLIFGVNLLTENDEKITVFVNHWPSRRGGQKESEPNRIAAAQTLRDAVDRIFNKDANAKIMVIGDFNDEPVNISVLETLKAYPINCDSSCRI